MSIPAESNPLLTFDDVTYARNDHAILSRNRLSVSRGELVVIAGRSGSGKTTLLKLASGLISPTRGRISTHFDFPDTPSTQQLPPIALVRQQPENQLIAGTVEEEVAFALSLANLPHAELHDRVESALRRTGLLDVRMQPPHTLSGGTMQRLAVAAALAMGPQLWLFDEPTSYLDPPSRHEVQQLAHDCAKTGAVLYVASSPDEWQLGDRLILLHEGHILADGSPPEVLAGSEVAKTGLQQHDCTHVWQTLFKTGYASDKHAGRFGHLPESLKQRSRTVPSAELGAVPLLKATGIDASRSALMSEKRQVLHGINLEVGTGECIALIGPAGAGKTTLLEVLANLNPIDSGLVSRGIVNKPDQSGYIGTGISFQFPERQFFAETVFDEIAYGVRNTGVAASQVNQIVVDALWRVGLGLEHSGRNPFDLSGGEARRVALAIVLALRPRLLLLDEPTAGLDSVDAERIGALLEEETRAGRSVIVSGHDLDRFAEWCPRWVMLKEGRVVYDGPPSALSKGLRNNFWS